MTDQTGGAPTPAPSLADVAPINSSAGPILLLEGQPISPEAAQARLDALRADPDFQKRIEAKDSEAFSLNTKLWKLSRGMSADLVPPQTAVDVYQQHADRGVQVAEAHADVIEKNYDLTDKQLHEVIFQRPVLLEEKQRAEIEYKKLTGDKTWLERWRNGDRQARTEMYLLNAIKAAPAATLQQVLEWDRRNPFNPEIGMGR
jgi:hypothetical protein